MIASEVLVVARMFTGSVKSCGWVICTSERTEGDGKGEQGCRGCRQGMPHGVLCCAESGLGGM